MAVYNTIDDPSKYFQATIYSGTGSAASVTNSGNSNLQPDTTNPKQKLYGILL